MKIAIIGSRNLRIDNLGNYLPSDVDEIVSGGASGTDECARLYAQASGIKLTEFLPDYGKYGRSAPLKRNLQIIQSADKMLVFWNGHSTGSKHVIDNCHRLGIPVEVIRFDLPTAYFVQYPTKLEDLTKLHTVSQRQPYIVEATIELDQIDFENFINDLAVYRHYFEVSKVKCRVDKAGVYHCLLVKQKGNDNGILVLSTKGLVMQAAFVSNTATPQ